jgi:Glycosyl transferase 4-like domain
MHVVIVSDFAAVNGGAARVAIDSARGLAEAGIDVTFACAIGEISPVLDHPRIEVARFAMDDVWQMGSKLAAARQGIWNAPAHAFLKNLFGRVARAGSVIHLHQWTKAFSPSALAAAGESGLPVMVSMHDYFSFCPAGGYYDFQAGKPCSKAPMGAACLASNCDRASYAHKLVRLRANGARTRRSTPLLT